jgi:lipopolysaccharide heptosyltransferase I
MSTPDSILAIRLSSFGDVLMTIPAVKAIREQYPHARLAWLVEGSVGELLAHQGFIDEAIRFPRGSIQASIKSGNLSKATKEMSGFLKKLRSGEYDLILDFHGIIKSALFSTLVKGKRTIGFGKSFAKEKSHLFYHECVESENKRLHKVERNMLIPRHLGIDSPVPAIKLEAPSDAEAYIDKFFSHEGIAPPVFAINPFSSKGSRFKRWDIERYGELIRRITGDNLGKAIILWGPGEKGEAKHLREIAGEEVFLSCPTDVPQLLALLSRADMYIGGDTGMMHLAALAGTPVLAIFGPTDHKINGPYGPLHRIIRKDLPCSPCKNKDCQERRCLREITVDEVFEAVFEMHKKIEGN